MAIDAVALGMTEHLDTYDDLGEVVGYVLDLAAAWADEQERRRVTVSERDAGFVMEVVQPAPRDVVWSFMTDPAIRPRWQADVVAVDELPTAPRRGIGTTNHCMHGTDVMVEEILDWRPTDYVTHRTTLPNGLKLVSTYAFQDAPQGTLVRLLFTWGKNRREREELASVRELLADLIGRGQAALHDVLAEEMARRATLAADASPEPVAPSSMGRELRQPAAR